MQTSLLVVRGARRAFSLVEMMVVLLILAVVLAIVVPALSAARNTARKAATNSLMNQLAMACAQFQMDERRLPGYFTPRDLGAAENGDRGFTTMHNIMADLAGGVVQTDNTPTTIEVGPLAGQTILIDTALIGSARQIKGVTNKAYFQPDPKFFGVVSGKEANGNDNALLPDLFDSWGTPILAWQQDDVPNTTGDFASANATSPAKFYWVQNAAYLRSPNLGKFAINQSLDSIIGAPNATPGNTRVDSLMALLGNPTFPVDAAAMPLVPSTARAPIVFQSAGYNSTYCGRSERGGKLANSNGGVIAYTSPADAIDAFDDFLAKVSN
jgi:prepilin-type N-terminal cleavage/methylation domain-containing protein